MRMRMPQVGMPDWKWQFEGETMKMLRWILGIILVGIVAALVIVFWPTIMQTSQRYFKKCCVRETDELDDMSQAA